MVLYDLQKCTMSIYFICRLQTLLYCRVEMLHLVFLFVCAAVALVIGWTSLFIDFPSAMGCAIASDVIGVLCDLATMYILADTLSFMVNQQANQHGGLSASNRRMMHVVTRV